MLPTKFWIIWSSGFRGEDFQILTNQKQELSVAAMLVNGSGRNEQSLQRTCHRCFLPSLDSSGSVVLENFFQKSTNQKQELPVAAMFVKNGQTSAFYLVLISIVDCIVVLVALFSDKKSYRKYPVFNSTFTLYILELHETFQLRH